MCTRRICSRPLISGKPTCTWRSKRPGRNNALSSTSTRLVAAITITPSLPSKPSISTNNWFKVCSRSSWPPPMPAPRWRPTASISSIKMIQGAFFLACSNISRTRLAPTPTNISTKSEPEIEKNGTLASPAIALASKVLPVPGGPTINTPRGIVAPSLVNFSGSRKKSTISVTSCLASSHPATSANVTLIWSSDNILALDLPKLIGPMPRPPPAPPPLMLRMMNKNKPIINSTGKLAISNCIITPWRSGVAPWTSTLCLISFGISSVSVTAGRTVSKVEPFFFSPEICSPSILTLLTWSVATAVTNWE